VIIFPVFVVVIRVTSKHFLSFCIQGRLKSDLLVKGQSEICNMKKKVNAIKVTNNDKVTQLSFSTVCYCLVKVIMTLI
jgi:hypothetical protein